MKEIDNKFKGILKDFMEQQVHNDWKAYVISRGIIYTGVYKDLANTINNNRKQNLEKLVEDMALDSMASEKVNSSKIAIAREEAISKVMKIIDDAEEVRDLYKRVQVLEKAIGILGMKKTKSSNSAIVIKHEAVSELQKKVEEAKGSGE